ncbi:MAG: START domain-containing protein [Bacteroidota bacterium]
MQHFIPTILFVFSSFFSPKPADADWELHTEEEGISIFTRLEEEARFKEVKATFQIESSLDHFISVLNDASAYTDWVYKCIKSERLETVNESSFYYYIETDLPFPASNRDLIVFSTQWKDPVTGAIKSKSVGKMEFIPEKDGLVRIPYFQSQWIITPMGNGHLNVEYWGKTDPGGSIPAWIVNLGVAIGPINTMKSLKARVLAETGS